ncbi:MAG: D-alanyl-D-alanine carboxypeptidase family protein [Planktomarina sp.]|nr:D-alanyl-D-alanine carboxypeptidase family protein [Planktomarina sp.]
MFVRNKLIMLSILISTLLGSNASAFDTKAQAAYVLDQTTGTVLLKKRAEIALPPASMSKLMTLFLAFEALGDGRLLWDETLPVSQHAMNYGGSTMFLDTTDRVTVKDLLRGIIVLSGNDACAVIAEALSIDGTEAGFANMMTARAKKLGMNNSIFANSNGWPHPGQRMSMEDLGILADKIIINFPELYTLFAEKEFKFDGRSTSNTLNRNPLLSMDIGADGMKTGHTSEAGYGLVGSAKQGERRIIFVITGLETAKMRAAESDRLITWAFRQFSKKSLFPVDPTLAQASVWMGSSRTVGLKMSEPLQILVPTTGSYEITSKISYAGPLQAPISKGDIVAELIVSVDDVFETRAPLIAATSVPLGGLLTRLRTAAIVLLRTVNGGLSGT